MVQAGLEGTHFKNHTAFTVKEACKLTLTEVRNRISKFEIVISLRENHPRQVVFFPLGVTERGLRSSAHTVLAVITPNFCMIIDSYSIAWCGNTESYQTKFQGLMNTTNCSRLTVFTLLEIINQLDWAKIIENSADFKKEDITAHLLHLY